MYVRSVARVFSDADRNELSSRPQGEQRFRENVGVKRCAGEVTMHIAWARSQPDLIPVTRRVLVRLEGNPNEQEYTKLTKWADHQMKKARGPAIASSSSGHPNS